MYEKNYTIRKKCIFCKNDLNKDYFKSDLKNYVGHYAVELEETNFTEIPFNVCICEKCNTPQIKYLADINEVYKINHADSTGTTMVNLHKLNLEFILKYHSYIKNVIEIGSSKGVLADMILENLKLNYYIIEPNFFGDRNNKIIINDFYENVNDEEIDADTLIISHVFEHFYEPLQILNKIHKNKKIKNFFLVFPDLEYYINNNVLHLLNTEHTYYIDNNFLINLLKSYGFNLVEKIDYINHSVLFYFRRETVKQIQDLDFKNKNYNIDLYFNRINKTVELFNSVLELNNTVYLWPASIHSQYLFIFGLNYQKLKGLLDNSKLKINKKIYGSNLNVYSFSDTIKNNDIIFLINGGVFYKEIENTLKQNNIKYYTNE